MKRTQRRPVETELWIRVQDGNLTRKTAELRNVDQLYWCILLREFVITQGTTFYSLPQVRFMKSTKISGGRNPEKSLLTNSTN
jgi:hypothetical protein